MGVLEDRGGPEGEDIRQAQPWGWQGVSFGNRGAPAPLPTRERKALPTREHPLPHPGSTSSPPGSTLLPGGEHPLPDRGAAPPGVGRWPSRVGSSVSRVGSSVSRVGRRPSLVGRRPSPAGRRPSPGGESGSPGWGVPSSPVGSDALPTPGAPSSGWGEGPKQGSSGSLEEQIGESSSPVFGLLPGWGEHSPGGGEKGGFST